MRKLTPIGPPGWKPRERSPEEERATLQRMQAQTPNERRLAKRILAHGGKYVFFYTASGARQVRTEAVRWMLERGQLMRPRRVVAINASSVDSVWSCGCHEVAKALALMQAPGVIRVYEGVSMGQGDAWTNHAWAHIPDQNILIEPHSKQSGQKYFGVEDRGLSMHRGRILDEARYMAENYSQDELEALQRAFAKALGLAV